jgi:hypothetical protein
VNFTETSISATESHEMVIAAAPIAQNGAPLR